ncbi:ATP-grasp domain-containing protein [Candidatus Nitrosacidococcus sp. I8]|uniref:ATP-grasp domain-containing protein n=1 Tax=Candidatus Nitrosacidococcus sp. I8 TaxID=2942908 RepID=UPI002226B9E8|nr:ATP-grasp domain-containing protein [Candidatus Nitrosacidococcus sp. I8]
MLAGEKQPIGLIFGGGIENHLELLKELNKKWILLGNTYYQVKNLKDFTYFFPLLEELSIPTPQIQIHPPSHPEGWLYKSVYGTGGSHIRLANQCAFTSDSGYYFQKKINGQAGSVLFLANGKYCQIIGYNLLIIAPTKTTPYRYGGIFAPFKLSYSNRTLLKKYIEKIVLTTELRGLNGLDFIQDKNEKIWVLEINPRPPAAMDLYQDLFNPLSAHINGCLGNTLPIKIKSIAQTQGFIILYAPYDLIIPSYITWPNFCHDYPANGSVINQGDPICTIHAKGANIDLCYQQIAQRFTQLLTLFSPC